ncbi:MAG: BlaI/MecI/CopY family transcriptional regulator [Bacilli bacterium]|nr:BlaI/MecI/CopY family transcriptional regulator [Bacilli bacterium]
MNLDKEQKIKRFFHSIYEPVLDYGNLLEIGNNLKNNEQIVICLLNKKNGNMEQKSFNNIDDITLYLRNNLKLKYCEAYFNVHTSVNGQRKKEDIGTCLAIGLDFDRKDFESKEIDLSIDYIQGKFKELGLFYNILVDTGNGIHTYILIKPTTDIKLVTRVTKRICELTGADINACKPTQLLRIPTTYNNKELSEGIRKSVKLVHIDNEIKRKDINELSRRILRDSTTSGATKKTFKGNSCKRVEELASVQCSNRHENLLWLYGKLLQLGNTEGQIQIILDKFQELNQLEDFEYQVKWLKENGKPISPCNGCKYSGQCYKYEESREQLETDLVLKNTLLKKSSKKGAKKNMLKGNELLIYGIIYIQQETTVEKLVKEFTVKNRKTKEIKQCLSERTIKTCLKSMTDKGIVQVTKDGRKNIYSLKVSRRLLEEQKILLSSGALYERIKGNISEAEFQLYCFMKYLQWEQRNINKINSNFKLKITQKEIASLYGISVTECNRHIQGLIDGKYISIVEGDTHKSSKNGYDYYTYTLNY